MKSSLNKIISNMSGVVLGIGLDEKLAKSIDKNDKIIKCDLLNYSPKKSGKGKKEKVKKINIRNIRKIYKKKKVDYIICNYKDISNFLNTFVKDSVYINSNKLYFYGDVDIDLIKKKYSRYDTKIDVIKDKIIEIDNTESKNNKFKEFGYKMIDGVSNIIEIIGNILMG